MEYYDFLKTKEWIIQKNGINAKKLSSFLFPFQRDIVDWSLRNGRAAIFADCGLGKTPMQLEWARIVKDHTKSNVLILAPLAVSSQTVGEGEKFKIPIKYARECMLDSLMRGEAPYLSHLLYTQVLDDKKPEQRKLGMEAGFAWNKAADLVAVYEDLGISNGMKAGIKEHEKNGTPIEYRRIRPEVVFIK